MKKLVVLLFVILICLVGCETNSLDSSAETTDEVTASFGEDNVEQGNEEKVKVAVGAGYVHANLPSAQGADRKNFAGRLGARTNSHNAKEKHIFPPPQEDMRSLFARLVLCYPKGIICQAYMVVFAAKTTI